MAKVTVSDKKNPGKLYTQKNRGEISPGASSVEGLTI